MKSGNLVFQDIIPYRVAKKNCKFIPAQSSDNVFLPEKLCQTFCKNLQNMISFRMACAVVNLFEIIEIEKNKSPSRRFLF